jgi:hypothetical protein
MSSDLKPRRQETGKFSRNPNTKDWEVRKTEYMTYEEVGKKGDLPQVRIEKNLTLEQALRLVRFLGSRFSAHSAGETPKT